MKSNAPSTCSSTTSIPTIRANSTSDIDVSIERWIEFAIADCSSTFGIREFVTKFVKTILLSTHAAKVDPLVTSAGLNTNRCKMCLDS